MNHEGDRGAGVPHRAEDVVGPEAVGQQPETICSTVRREMFPNEECTVQSASSSVEDAKYANRARSEANRRDDKVQSVNRAELDRAPRYVDPAEAIWSKAGQTCTATSSGGLAPTWIRQPEVPAYFVGQVRSSGREKARRYTTTRPEEAHREDL